MSALIDLQVRHDIGAFRLDVTLRSDARLTALFGRSGAGKTSLINAIGGLIRPEQGRIAINGEVLVDTEIGVFVPKERRRIGYVFQDARLFPHLSVRQNLLYGRWFARHESGGMGIDQVIALLGLEMLLQRRPQGLSGGEKQRVAIGRALLARPRLLLMDEPLASLDEARKAEILPVLERLRDESDTPILYVSHAVREVVRLAGTCALMDQGRAVAVGPPAELLSRLDLAGLSPRREAGSILEGEVIGRDNAFGLSVVRTAAGVLHVGDLALGIGARTLVHGPASGIMISRAPLTGVSALNQLAAQVVEIGAGQPDEPFERQVRLECGTVSLLARVTAKSVSELALKPGDRVIAVVKSVSIKSPGDV